MGMQRWSYVGPWCRGLCKELGNFAPRMGCVPATFGLADVFFSKNDFGRDLWGKMLVVWVGWEQGFFMGMRRWGYVGLWCRGLCEELRNVSVEILVASCADRSRACAPCIFKNDSVPAFWNTRGDTGDMDFPCTMGAPAAR